MIRPSKGFKVGCSRFSNESNRCRAFCGEGRG